MKYLITGASGFLGTHILSHIRAKNEIFTIGRSNGSYFKCELSQGVPDLSEIKDTTIDFVLHIAGKAHVVPKNEVESAEFFKVNALGTKYLLDALNTYNVKVNTLVFISTVAVYGLEEGELIDENFPLKGDSPYAKSKIEAENMVVHWSNQSKSNLVILRLPLIYGDNAPGNLGAMEKAIKKGYYFRLGSGSAKRSIVDVQKLAQFIPSLLGKNGVFNITELVHPCYADIDERLAKKYNKKIRRISPKLARLMAKVGDRIPKFPLNTYRLSKLEQSLTFSSEKARKDIEWI